VRLLDPAGSPVVQAPGSPSLDAAGLVATITLVEPPAEHDLQGLCRRRDARRVRSPGASAGGRIHAGSGLHDDRGGPSPSRRFHEPTRRSDRGSHPRPARGQLQQENGSGLTDPPDREARRPERRPRAAGSRLARARRDRDDRDDLSPRYPLRDDGLPLACDGRARGSSG
jgi:hypothetical protein